MDVKSKMAVLVAKTGIFFANCDGEYDEREREFITRYVQELKQEDGASEELTRAIEETLMRRCTYEEIVVETQRVLSSFNEAERKAILEKLKEFIDKVICADDYLHPNEVTLFERWKNDLNVN